MFGLKVKPGEESKQVSNEGVTKEMLAKEKATSKHLKQHGSLLIMKEGCQRTHLHSLPKTKKIISQRINLTFRSFKSLK
jgi:hypothetical protein